MGNLLVMDRHARLPNVCLLTGRPATKWVEREVSYYPAAVHLVLLVGIVPYVFYLLNLSTVVKIEIGLCERCFERQRLRLFFGKLLGGLGTAGILGAISLGLITKEHEVATVLIFLSAVIGTAGLALFLWGGRLVTAKKIDEDYIWLRGVDQDFLATLPKWPGK